MFKGRTAVVPPPTNLLADAQTSAAPLDPDHTTARWEKRYNHQLSATETALLEKRNAKISLREIERVLEEERTEAARAAHEASVAAAEAAETLRDIADAQDEGEGGLKIALRWRQKWLVLGCDIIVSFSYGGERPGKVSI